MGPRDWEDVYRFRQNAAAPARDTHPGRTCQAPRIKADKTSDEPIYQQIYESVRDGIMIGDWKPGDRLPSIRNLAAELDVANNTVSAAYRQLTAEGFVESKRGSGYVVCETLSDALNFSFARQTTKAEPVRETKRMEYACDFGYGDVSPDLFPLAEWRRLANTVISPDNLAQLASYGDGQGEWDLRQQICRMLGETRGIVCTPNQVVVTNGTRSSVALALALVGGAGPVAMEDPGFPPARRAIADAQRDVETLRTDCGADAFLDDVRASKARVAYLTPTHQFPLGQCMSQGTRAQLLLAAMDDNAYLIEDDYDRDLRYNVQPVPPLKAIDQRDRVIYVGSFSKVLSPALRIGYVVLPHALLRRYAALYGSAHCAVPWVEQAMLAQFMESGEYLRHVRRVTRAYRKRSDRLRSCLRTVFGSRVEACGVEAGLFATVKVNNRMSEDELVKAAAEQGVRVQGASRYWANPAEAPSNYVLIGFSNADEKTISKGMRLLFKAWFPEAESSATSAEMGGAK